MITDLIQLLIVCGIAVFLRTANSFCLSIPFAFTFYYSYGSPLFDSHTAVINHFTQGMAFIFPAFYARKPLATALCVYAAFHLFVGIDYFIYENQTLISESYFLLNNALNFLLILASLDRGYNDSKGSYRNAVFNPIGVVNLWHNQSHTKESAKP